MKIGFAQINVTVGDLRGNFDKIATAYEQLARWTRFWLDHRRVPGDPLPFYQHGNDSGWDNATTFDPGRVAQSADLAAHRRTSTCSPNYRNECADQH